MFTNLLVNCFVKKTMKAAKVPLIIAHHIQAMEQVRVKIVLLLSNYCSYITACFKSLGSQVAADGGCERDVVHRMNEGYRAWGVLKSVLSNRGLGIKAMVRCLHGEVSIRKSNCTNGIVRIRGMGYEKC